ncbi:MAG: proton-conducting membrane transporter, partial [Oscillospiraceae bacterium]|nr:proton-conducting membrane transporter [Oscillospiraceae bacterium]
GIKYLGFSVCGAALGLLGLFFLSGYWSTPMFTPGGVLDAALVSGHEGALVAAFFIMIIGFGAKAGLFPLFAWLPTAHPVAPSPASAVLSGLITKMGVLAIIRVIYFQFGVDFVSGTWAQQAAIWLAIFTIFMGSMLAFKEKVLKKRLAYSTVSNVSYVLFGLLVLSPDGLTGALMQVFFHAIAKNGLFLAAGAIIFYTGMTKTNELRGVGKKLPVTMSAFTLCAMSLIGIPPTGGFVAKWYLAQGGLAFGGAGIFGVAILMVSALLTAGYLLPIVTDAFFPGPDFDYASLKKTELSWPMKLTVIALGIALVAFSVFPGIPADHIEVIVSTLF